MKTERGMGDGGMGRVSYKQTGSGQRDGHEGSDN